MQKGIQKWVPFLFSVSVQIYRAIINVSVKMVCLSWLNMQNECREQQVLSTIVCLPYLQNRKCFIVSIVDTEKIACLSSEVCFFKRLIVKLKTLESLLKHLGKNVLSLLSSSLNLNYFSCRFYHRKRDTKQLTTFEVLPIRNLLKLLSKVLILIKEASIPQLLVSQLIILFRLRTMQLLKELQKQI